MSLDKIKELRIKAESAKALFEIADDESERKHFKKMLESYKKELLKFLDEPKPSRTEPQPQQEPKRLAEILADNQADLAENENDKEPDLF